MNVIRPLCTTVEKVLVLNPLSGKGVGVKTPPSSPGVMSTSAATAESLIRHF